MKKRSPIAVFLLGLVTIGFYSWYWAVKTKGEMNRLGEKIPTAWIWLIPFVGSIWWYWKYSEGVEHITNEKLNWVMAFIVLFLLGNIGQAIVQDFFNKTELSAVTTPTPLATSQQQTGIVTPNQPTSTVVTPSNPQLPNSISPNQQPSSSTPPNPPIIGG